MRLTSGDHERVLEASDLFDGPAQAEATKRFLDDPGHHLLLAYDGEEAVGFVTGVEMTHPDKGTELFLYELGVAEHARGKGVALPWSRRSLVSLEPPAATACGP